MVRNVLFGIGVFLIICSYCFGASSISCNFRQGACLLGESPLLYVDGTSVDSLGRVANAHVSTKYNSASYNKTLCCSSPYGSLGFENISKSDECAQGDFDMLYLTNLSNSHIGVRDIDITGTHVFNLSRFNYKMCVSVPSGMGTFNIFASNKPYEYLGYSCLYRMSSLDNGHVSDCDAEYVDVLGAFHKYEYAIWGQMFEHESNLNCNNDCVSVLTNRVNYECRNKVSGCENVPIACHGALLGTWVDNLTGNNAEVQCSKPWINYRNEAFTKSPVEVTSVSGKCSNLISKKYSIKLNNELVVMNVFVCND